MFDQAHSCSPHTGVQDGSSIVSNGLILARKKAIALLCLCGLILALSSAAAACNISPSNGITCVQSNSKTINGTFSGTLAFSSNNTAGNLIVVVMFANGGDTATPTDSRNSYQPAVANQLQSPDRLSIYYAQNIGAGANTVSVSAAATTTKIQVVIFEFSGLATTGALDQAGGASGASSVPASPSVTTTTSPELLIGAQLRVSAGAISSGTGYTLELCRDSCGSATLGTEDQILSSPQTVSATWGGGTVAKWASSIATFHASGPTTTYGARTDNCVTGNETGCTAGRSTGQANSPMSFLYRTTDGVPFPSMNCTTGTQSSCANNTATDADFGSYMVMVTDPLVSSPSTSFNMGANGEYDAFNQDSTMMLVAANGGGTWIYSINPSAVHAKTCTPSAPCVVKSAIRTQSGSCGTTVPATNCTNLLQQGDWSFSRKPGESTILYEEDPGGTTIYKLTIHNTGAPSAWTLDRDKYVDFKANITGVDCSVLPSNYAVGWTGVFAPGNDGSVTKALGGGPPWVAATAYTTESFIYPSSGNTGKHAYQVITAGTSCASPPTWPQTTGATVTESGVGCTSPPTWQEAGKMGLQGDAFDIVNYRPGIGCSHVNTRLGKVYRGTSGPVASEPAGLWTSQDDIVCTRMGASAPCSLSDRLTMHEAGQPFDSHFVTISPTGGGSKCSQDAFAAGKCSCAPPNSDYRSDINGGLWLVSASYTAHDLVYYNHSWYQANVAISPNQPSPNVNSNWDAADSYCYTYVWQPNSTLVNPCIEVGSAGGCGGHSEKGFTFFYKGTKLQSHLYSLPSIGGNANPGINMLPNDIPGDRHGSGRNEDSTDTLPFGFFDTDVPTSPLRYNVFVSGQSTAGYAEDIAIKPDGSETMYRFMHNYNTGSSSEFAIQNAIGVISQDGQFAAIGTDMMSRRGSLSGSSTCNGLRGDIQQTKAQSVTSGQNGYPLNNNSHHSIYTAINSGTEVSGSGSLPNWDTACGNAGEYCTIDKTISGTPLDGNVVWLNLGANNCRGDVVLIDLLSAHPVP